MTTSSRPRSSSPKSSGPKSSGPKSSSPKPTRSASSRSTPSRAAEKPKKNVKKGFLAVAVLAGGFLIALGILVGFLDGYGQKNRTQRASAIVVLGAGVRADGKAGLGLQRRVLHAVRLYKKGFATKIIMTGGVGTHPPAEAEVAAQLAIKNGVAREDVLREDKSTSTWENALYASKICKRRGWKNVIVVSDPFHLWRAQRNFQKCGLRPYTSPVAVEMWQHQPLQKGVWTAREALLVVRDWCLRRV